MVLLSSLCPTLLALLPLAPIMAQELPQLNHGKNHHHHRLLMSTDTNITTTSYDQYEVYMYLYPPSVQQDVLLSVRANPSRISTQDIAAIENEFQDAYNRQQILASTGAAGVDYYPVYVTSCQILTDKEMDGAIDGFGDKPPTITQTVDYSYIMQVDYNCFGCPDNMDLNLYNVADYDDSSYDPRESYQVPFPSSLSPIVPSQADVLADLKSSGFFATIDGLEDIYDIDTIPTDRCDDSDFTAFSSYFSIAVDGDYNIPDLNYQLGLAEQAIVEVYNELNVLNPFSCDVDSRIATTANVAVVDPRTESSTRRRLNNKKFKYSWFFLYAEMDGKCNGCPTGTCATNDVSGHSNCDDGARRRKLQEVPPEQNTGNNTSCYCVEDNVNATLPTNEEFQMALTEQFERMRNETNFTLVEDVVYLIEVDVPDSCCGWPVDANQPVDVNAGDFRAAVTSYVDTGTSPYGTPINCWDVSRVTSMANAFQGQSDFNEAIGCWDTSNVTTMFFMLQGATNFNNDISDWDTSQVTAMGFMFGQASSFNIDLSLWDVSSVTSMNAMFTFATNFNHDGISNWDTSNVGFIGSMFTEATSFNVDISGWNTSKVTSIRQMFRGASSFNQDISSWDTSRAESFDNMFNGATSFNIDISGWDISSVTNVASMFSGASQFNQNLCPWRLQADNLDFAGSVGVFTGTSCSNMSDPTSGVGPWCFTCE